MTVVWLGQQRAIGALGEARRQAVALQREAEAASQAKGKLDIDPANADIHDFVRRCAALWAPRAQDKNLVFEKVITPGTPQWVVVDVTRTGQIVFNLISNALKFTEASDWPG